MKFCIWNKLPDDANIAGPQISFWWGQDPLCSKRTEGVAWSPGVGQHSPHVTQIGL